MPINLQVWVVIKMFPTKIYFTNMDPFPSSYRKSKYKNIHRKMEIYKFLPLKVPPIVSFNRCCLVQLFSRVRLFAIPWTTAYPVCHQRLELAQTPVHRVRDAIHPSHSLSSPSPPAFNLFQHQGLFQ